ncbi:MAG: hypothetical protein SFW62_09470 [Alphaproteobacteria bacterium]|nr:hypothetical protein [Alphaproteobacteria bacterium]
MSESHFDREMKIIFVMKASAREIFNNNSESHIDTVHGNLRARAAANYADLSKLERELRASDYSHADLDYPYPNLSIIRGMKEAMSVLVQESAQHKDSIPAYIETEIEAQRAYVKLSREESALTACLQPPRGFVTRILAKLQS